MSQLSRNAFRGTDEAFQYDHVSEKIVPQLVQDFLGNDADKQSVPGEFYPPYLSFMATALMHAEDIETLNLASKLVDAGVHHYKDQPKIKQTLEFQKGFLKDHREVVERFGRYPHRNAKKGRENTPEEQAWLDDVDNLPGWAKSQG
ncbi:MAG: hypothetical protein SGILL_005423 [Bacillariaceae sp.]